MNSYRFTVPDMSCGHCVQAITQAVAAADPQAQTQCDLTTKIVTIGNAASEAQTLLEAIREAGFEPQSA
ncbi:heavy-metal-associated domain-containing protein [Plasticicumulans acidivorans]|uniref:Copper chaperone n=1 Tax=Plasticicumulans acidivorans TaxID=886464 RepID=A0A317N016_9GAMM|nr:heavy-metal-associated domain-containing protein [Plasticicumulans acidivorans]PWV65835.1 copper chaperone [Plasticicumulans acidivorans]